MIDIKGLDKAEVIKALYRGAQPLGLGVLSFETGGLQDSEAQQLAESGTYIDYLHGRVMKVDLSGDAFNEALYDRDNGQGKAQAIIDSLRNNTEYVEEFICPNCGHKWIKDDQYQFLQSLFKAQALSTGKGNIGNVCFECEYEEKID